MAKSSPVKSPSTPAAPSAADAASAAGNQSSQVGAGKQPGAGDSSAPGSASDVKVGEITQDLRVHAAAVQADIPTDVLFQACAPCPEISEVLAARRYADRWVLVVMSATRCWKVEVAL